MEADRELRFAYQLGAQLGILDPETALESVPYDVFRKWWDLWELEPFGFEWRDRQVGLVAATLANAWAENAPFVPEHFTYRRAEAAAEVADGEDWNIGARLSFLRQTL